MNNIQTEISNDLRSARHSIKVAVSWLTDTFLINELIDARKRGVDVKVIVSSNELNIIRFELFQKLIDLGTTVNKEGSEDAEKGDFMHYKFYIIDDKVAKSGSYNWSINAVTNREALDEVSVSKKLNEFNECFKASVNFFADIHNPAQKKAELSLIEKEHKDALTPEKLAAHRHTQSLIKQQEERYRKELEETKTVESVQTETVELVQTKAVESVQTKAVEAVETDTVKLENCQSVRDWLNTSECKSLKPTGFDLGLSALARELEMEVGDTVVLECMPESFKTVGTTEFNKDKVAIYWQPASEEIESTQSFVSYLGNNKSTPLSNLHIGDTQMFVASLYAIPCTNVKSATALEAYKADLASGTTKGLGRTYQRGGLTLQPARGGREGQAFI